MGFIPWSMVKYAAFIALTWSSIWGWRRFDDFRCASDRLLLCSAAVAWRVGRSSDGKVAVHDLLELLPTRWRLRLDVSAQLLLISLRDLMSLRGAGGRTTTTCSRACCSCACLSG